MCWAEMCRLKRLEVLEQMGSAGRPSCQRGAASRLSCCGLRSRRIPEHLEPAVPGESRRGLPDQQRSTACVCRIPGFTFRNAVPCKLCPPSAPCGHLRGPGGRTVPLQASVKHGSKGLLRHRPRPSAPKGPPGRPPSPPRCPSNAAVPVAAPQRRRPAEPPLAGDARGESGLACGSGALLGWGALPLARVPGRTCAHGWRPLGPATGLALLTGPAFRSGTLQQARHAPPFLQESGKSTGASRLLVPVRWPYQPDCAGGPAYIVPCTIC